MLAFVFLFFVNNLNKATSYAKILLRCLYEKLNDKEDKKLCCQPYVNKGVHSRSFIY